MTRRWRGLDSKLSKIAFKSPGSLRRTPTPGFFERFISELAPDGIVPTVIAGLVALILVIIGQGIAPEQPTRVSSPRGTESLRTLCWRGMGSNFCFRDALAPPIARPWCDAA